MVKRGKACDTVWVFIGPNHQRSLPSSGVMEQIKLPHSHVSASRPFSFANRKCLFKYSSLQHVLEPSAKPKMSTRAPLGRSGRHLAAGEKRASACLQAGRGEGAPVRVHFHLFQAATVVGEELHLWAPFVLRRVNATSVYSVLHGKCFVSGTTIHFLSSVLYLCCTDNKLH